MSLLRMWLLNEVKYDSEFWYVAMSVHILCVAKVFEIHLDTPKILQFIYTLILLIGSWNRTKDQQYYVIWSYTCNFKFLTEHK